MRNSKLQLYHTYTIHMKPFFFSAILFVLCFMGILRPGNAFAGDDHGGSIYHVNLWTVNAFNVTGSVLDYISIKPLHDRKPVITAEELSKLQRDSMNFINRWATKLNAKNYRTYEIISYYCSLPIFILPPLLMLNKTYKDDWFKLATMFWQGHTITFFTYNYSWLGPRFRNRYRPVVYYDEVSSEYRTIGYNRSSFYSGHTASMAFTSFAMAKIYCDYAHAGSHQKIIAYSIASVFPLAEGYLRVRALAHFPTDCLVGLAVGAAVGILTPELHKINIH